MVTADALNRGAGPKVKFHAALKSKRAVWLSDAYQKRHPAIATIIKQCVASWRKPSVKIVETEAIFLHAKLNANEKRQSRQVIGICTKAEKHEKGANYNVDSEVVEWLKNMDYSKRSQGLSGR